jgi:iron complex outermembrane recepter protein
VGTGSSAGGRSNVSVTLRLAALLATTMNCGVAFAQGTVATPEAAAKTDQQAEITEIVVTAQRREQRLSDVPMSVQAQSGEALRQAGVTGTAMLEQISPALSFASAFSADASSLSIRGVQSFSTVGGVQPSVGVVIDSVPVARQIEAVLDFSDIDRIEVLSGPQGTLFGKNATAGVVNIVTNRPRHEFGASAELTGTNDKEGTAKAMLNVPLSDKIAFRLNGYYDYLDPLVRNLAGPDEYGRRAAGVNGKLLFDLSENINLLLTAQHNHSWDSTGVFLAVVPVSGPLGAFQRQLLGPAIGWGADVVNQNSPSFDLVDTQSYTAELNAKLTNNFSLVAITGYRSLNETTAVDIDVTPVGGNIGTGLSPNPLNYPIESIVEPNQHSNRFKYWSQEVRLNYSAPGIDIVTGAYYQKYSESRYLRTTFRFDGSRIGLTPGVKYISDSIIPYADIADDTFAVFGDATKEIVPTVKLFGGLRYTNERLTYSYDRTSYLGVDNGSFNFITQVNSAPPSGSYSFSDLQRTDNNVSGRAGVQWEPATGLNFYASYNRGYKGPAVNASAAVLVATALLKPEIAQAFEIGAKQRFFEGRLAVDAALYKQQIDNIQQSALIAGQVTTSLITAGALKTDGFEVTVTARPTQGLTLNSGIVYNHARYSGPYRFSCGPSATPGAGACAANGTFSLDGTPAVGTPAWKVVTSALYENDVREHLRMTTRVAYDWRSAIQYTLFHDPLTEQPAYGILNASIALGSSDDRWQATLFGNNLANKFYYAYLGTAAASIGQSYGFLPRDYKRYGGIRLSYKF